MRESGREERAPALVHIFPSFARGGQQMRLAALARGLGGAFRHRVISLDGDRTAENAFDAGAVGLQIFRARKSAGLSIANIRGLRRLIEGADLLCTYNFGALEAAIANRLGPKLPHIHFEDGFGPDESPVRQKWRRVLARRAALGKSIVVVPSRELEEMALKRWRLKHVRHIPNGIDVARFVSAAGADNASPVVGSVGALRPEKNYPRLVRAIAAAGPGAAHLIIHGEGPSRKDIEQAAAKSAIRVDLPGQTQSPEKAYAAMDIFALSSDTEQMPLSLMEAMAAGLPVVSTDVGDVRLMVSDENRAFVTPPGDEAAYAAALRSLIEDGALRARLGAANAQKARAEFGLDRMIEAYRALFHETLAQER